MDTSHRTGARHRLTPSGMLLVLGGVLLLVAAPMLFAVAVTTEAGWAMLAGLVCAVAGLLMVGRVFAPQRASFRAGTKIWQNDGLPGGGAGGL